MTEEEEKKKREEEEAERKRQEAATLQAKKDADETAKKDSGFKAITSQDDLDAIVTSRLRRQEKSLRAELRKEIEEEAEEEQAKESGKYKDLYDKALEKIEKLEGEKRAAELTELKAKVAKEVGLPESAIPRLVGDDEETLKKDAKSLLEIVGSSKEDTEVNADLGNSNQPKRPKKKADEDKELEDPNFWGLPS